MKELSTISKQVSEYMRIIGSKGGQKTASLYDMSALGRKGVAAKKIKKT